jgi:hypothetical protein
MIAMLSLTLVACATTGAGSPQTPGIQPSPAIVDAVRHFYQRMRSGDPAGFDEFISSDPSLLVIGSAGEWFTQRERLRGVFRLKNEGLEAGQHPVAYQNGDLGWFVDQPDWVFRDGSRVHMRFTVILHNEASSWKAVHWHLSVAVPDDEVVGLQHRWLEEKPN